MGARNLGWPLVLFWSVAVGCPGEYSFVYSSHMTFLREWFSMCSSGMPLPDEYFPFYFFDMPFPVNSSDMMSRVSGFRSTVSARCSGVSDYHSWWVILSLQFRHAVPDEWFSVCGSGMPFPMNDSQSTVPACRSYTCWWSYLELEDLYTSLC